MPDESLESVFTMADSIFKKTKSDRSLDIIFANCLRGKIAEYGAMKIIQEYELKVAWTGASDDNKYNSKLDSFDIIFEYEELSYKAEVKSTTPKNKYDKFFTYNLSQHKRGLNLSNFKNHPDVSILIQVCVNEISNTTFEVYVEYVFTSNSMIFKGSEKMSDIEDYEYRLEYSKAIADGYCFKLYH